MRDAVYWDIKSSSYLTGDTLHLRYRAQSVKIERLKELES
jgi:hypothetical protein